MKKKKVMLSLAAAAMVGTLAVGGTLAWFTDTETATNVVTIGDLDIVWNEGAENENEAGTDITGKTEGLQWGKENPIVPGKEFNKNARIKNVGKNPAFVRATVEIYVNGKRAPLPVGYEIEFPVDTEGYRWAADGDTGDYYYLGTVDPGKSTEFLIGKVKVLDTATDEIQDQVLTIQLHAEAIQAENITTKEVEDMALADYKKIFEENSITNKTKEEQGN